MGILGTQEIVILVIMLAIMFGAKKIPELARNAGRAKGEFQRGLQEGMSIAGDCLLYTSPSPRDQRGSRMPSSA